MCFSQNLSCSCIPPARFTHTISLTNPFPAPANSQGFWAGLAVGSATQAIAQMVVLARIDWNVEVCVKRTRTAFFFPHLGCNFITFNDREQHLDCQQLCLIKETALYVHASSSSLLHPHPHTHTHPSTHPHTHTLSHTLPAPSCVARAPSPSLKGRPSQRARRCCMDRAR